jgi:phosphoenolpyruvate carboxylase
MRQNSDVHERTVAELFEKARCPALVLSRPREEARIALLLEELRTPRLLARRSQYSPKKPRPNSTIFRAEARRRMQIRPRRSPNCIISKARACPTCWKWRCC